MVIKVGMREVEGDPRVEELVAKLHKWKRDPRVGLMLRPEELAELSLYDLEVEEEERELFWEIFARLGGVDLR